MRDSSPASKSEGHAVEFVPSGPYLRLRNFGLLFGALVLVLVAALVFQAVRSAAKDKEAILHNALDQGFWIARSLEIGHSLLLEEQKDALQEMVKEITRHPAVESLLVVNEDRRVLAASDAALIATRWADVLGETPEHGKVLRSDSRTAELAFPAFFSEASLRMGNMHPRRDRSVDQARWVVVTLDTSAEYAHYRSSVIQSIVVLSVTLVLGFGAFFVLRVFQRTLKLEQMKTGLERFVPRTVQKLIEDNPDQPMFDKVRRNATVLFLDIERYTRMSEEMSAETLNGIVEKYFSAFLDLILARGGEINETAGDGIMAIFTGKTAGAHALSAVAAAVAIRTQAQTLNRARQPNEPEILVNIGINSGEVLIGATAIKGETGEHLTYTASGSVTNIAARLCGLGEKGEICVSGATAELVGDRIEMSGPVRTSLKHVREAVPVYRVA